MDPQFRIAPTPWPPRWRLLGGMLGLVLAVALGAWVWGSQQVPVTVPKEQGMSETALMSSDSTETASSATSEPVAKIYVDLKGAVRHPGVYALPQGSRVFDLIEAAGGLTDEAADRAINQAQLLVDQASLYVPTLEEWEAAASGPATAGPGLTPPTGSGAEGQAPATSGSKVNLNQADAAQLQTLPGIGAKKAQAIIDYRMQHGSFGSVDELTQVKGIGPKLLEKLREAVTVQ